jgi:hypothetical protein
MRSILEILDLRIQTPADIENHSPGESMLFVLLGGAFITACFFLALSDAPGLRLSWGAYAVWIPLSACVGYGVMRILLGSSLRTGMHRTMTLPTFLFGILLCMFAAMVLVMVATVF